VFRLFKKRVNLQTAAWGLAALTITGGDKNKNLLEQIRGNEAIDQGCLLYELWFIRMFVVHEAVQGFKKNTAKCQALISGYEVAAKELVRDEFALDLEQFERDVAERLHAYVEAARITHPSGPMWSISGAFLKFLEVDEYDLALRMLISIEAGATAVAVKSFLGNIRLDHGK
jgi:hypothetical protein